MTQAISTDSIQDLQEAVRISPRIFMKCAGSKTALASLESDATLLDISHLRGIVSYDPSEYTITAWAGTPLAELQKALAENKQYLPFDPPLDGHGASLGGTTAAGLNGPGSYRFGGMRDFMLAVQFIDGTGNLVKGGARVVKNAAGFDTPKLFIGSLGLFGILVNITYKVFPKPDQFATIHRYFDRLDDALAIHSKFYNNPLEVEALNLSVETNGFRLSARIGGRASSVQRRSELLQAFLGGGEIVCCDEDRVYWDGERNFHWLPGGWALVKIPLTPSMIGTLEAKFSSQSASPGTFRHYSNGGQLVWVGLPDLPENLTLLSRILENSELSGLKILGKGGAVRVGRQVKNVFSSRVKKALDPQSRFLEV